MSSVNAAYCQIGDYEYDINHKLGSGGFGAVFKGRNKHTGMPVAVKAVPNSKLRRQEVRASNELKHPNIITVLEIVEDVEETFFILEWCEHGDLLQLVNMYEFTEKEAREVILQILSALEYSYRKGWAHLDVKLENILIKGNRFILSDWGLSSRWRPDRVLSAQCGSMLYLSPEQHDGKYFHGPEVDAWGLGVCLHAMICRTFPFMGANHAEVRAGMTRPLIFPAAMSIECRDLLSRLLEVNPAKRMPLPDIRMHPWLRAGMKAAVSSGHGIKSPIRTRVASPDRSSSPSPARTPSSRASPGMSPARLRPSVASPAKHRNSVASPTKNRASVASPARVRIVAPTRPSVMSPTRAAPAVPRPQVAKPATTCSPSSVHRRAVSDSGVTSSPRLGPFRR